MKETQQIIFSMKSSKIILSQFLAIIMMFGFAELSKAQDEARGEAIELYNQAQEMAGANEFDEAITLYRDALNVANQNQLTDIVDLINQRLPNIYFSRAGNSYQQFQKQKTVANLDATIEAFKEAEEAANEFGNSQVAQRASGNVTQLYYLRGVVNYQQENFEAALTDLNTALEMNANYDNAQYQKAVVTKNMKPTEVEAWLTEYDKAIALAEQNGNTKVANNAKSGARDELIFRAVNLSDERNFGRAVELLNKASEYDDSSYQVPYRLAEIANKRGNWSTAETEAREALSLHSGGVADKAKIYFELGTALKGQGNFEGACSAFEDARYGDFTEPANHELQFELKCEGHTATGR